MNNIYILINSLVHVTVLLSDLDMSAFPAYFRTYSRFDLVWFRLSCDHGSGFVADQLMWDNQQTTTTTRTRSFGKLSTTFIPVPDTLVSSVRPRQNTLVPGTTLFKYPGYGYGHPWYPGTVLFMPGEWVQSAGLFMQGGTVVAAAYDDRSQPWMMGYYPSPSSEELLWNVNVM